MRPRPSGSTPERRPDRSRWEWIFHAQGAGSGGLTLEEIQGLLEDGVLPRGTRTVRWVDVARGLDRALRAMEEGIAAREPLTRALLCRWHALLEPDSVETRVPGEDGNPVLRRLRPGHFRTEPAAAPRADGEPFGFASPGRIEAQVTELLAALEDGAPEMHPVVHAARCWHRFLAIRPFDAANGRVALLLANWILQRQGYPFLLALRREEARAALDALQQADAGEPGPWQTLVARHVLDTLTRRPRAAREESADEPEDVDKALQRLKRELASVEEPQELSPERFRRVLTGSIGPLIIRMVDRLRAFDEFYSVEKLSISCSVFGDAGFEAAGPGPGLEGRKSHAKKWLADLPASLVMSELIVAFSWEGFRKGGLNDFGTSLAVRFLFERRKYHVQCEPLLFSRSLLYQQKLPEEEGRQLANDLARRLLARIRRELLRAAA